MVLLGHTFIGVQHRGLSRRALSLVLLPAGALLVAGTWFLVQRYNERPPWAQDVAYEAGFIQGSRTRHADPTGRQAKDLLAGGCERLEATGLAGLKASYDPGLWVAGCRDGAVGRPPVKQGLFH
ncbi:hypothetical protein [Streptomyces sp. NPDC002889]|uniref:hypothetical protein n=1 Tax=Streptomyces sp. NPDC002889 TaxID=3364669 RepID=UPI00368E2244